MKNIVLLSLVVLFVSGCAATWNGVKEDTTSATDWTKKKVNDSASFVKEKTE
jgi:predicted small secreted protein